MSHFKLSALALAISSVLADTGYAGHEISSDSKKQIIEPTGPIVGGEVSAGYWSKYIFRGTNLTPDSDGLIWASGTLRVHPWENGSFMFQVWVGSQQGVAQVDGVERIGESGGAAIPNGTGTRAGFNESRITATDPSLQPLADAINRAYGKNFNDPNGISGQDFIDYLKDEFSILGQPGKSNAEIRQNYRDTYGKGIPKNVTRFNTSNEAIQDRFTEIDAVVEYRHQFFDGKLEIAVGNIFFYIDREEKSIATVREFFASDAARKFVNNLNNTILNVQSGRTITSAPVLTLREGHPEDFLLNKGKTVKFKRKSTGDEEFDRVYVDVTTNLLSQFYGLKPHLIYYQTLYNEGADGDPNLQTNRYDTKGGYLEFSMNASVPLVKTGSPASNDFKTGKAILGDEKIKLSIEPSFRISYSVRDRASADGTPLTGFNHLQLGAQLSWNITDNLSIHPMVSYARHLTEPTPGTDRDEWWGGGSIAFAF
jgi:hypothetical protein